MVFDSHLHFFTPKIIANVCGHPGLVSRLRLRTDGADRRLDAAVLAASMKGAGVVAGLALPTAGAAAVARINTFFMEKADTVSGLFTAGTLHPAYPHNREEIERLCRCGIRGIKLCSFSQGFRLDGSPALALFDLIEAHNRCGAAPFFVVLDTFYNAHDFFGTDPAHTTLPAQVKALARACPHTVFIAAHMGGLTAPFTELWSALKPCENLFLDTSNAAHTLDRGQFVALLARFGPQRIVFGTDWPWFTHAAEIARIDQLTEAAGFSPEQKAAVFYDNMAGLMGFQELTR
jgi:hypothetical protein